MSDTLDSGRDIHSSLSLLPVGGVAFQAYDAASRCIDAYPRPVEQGFRGERSLNPVPKVRVVEQDVVHDEFDALDTANNVEHVLLRLGGVGAPGEEHDPALDVHRHVDAGGGRIGGHLRGDIGLECRVRSSAGRAERNRGTQQPEDLRADVKHAAR